MPFASISLSMIHRKNRDTRSNGGRDDDAIARDDCRRRRPEKRWFCPSSSSLLLLLPLLFRGTRRCAEVAMVVEGVSFSRTCSLKDSPMVRLEYRPKTGRYALFEPTRNGTEDGGDDGNRRRERRTKRTAGDEGCENTNGKTRGSKEGGCDGHEDVVGDVESYQRASIEGQGGRSRNDGPNFLRGRRLGGGNEITSWVFRYIFGRSHSTAVLLGGDNGGDEEGQRRRTPVADDDDNTTEKISYAARPCPCAESGTTYCLLDESAIPGAPVPDTCGIVSEDNSIFRMTGKKYYEGEDSSSQQPSSANVDSDVRCFKIEAQTAFIRDAWPVVLLWYGALLVFLGATDNGKNVRQYVLHRCCPRRLHTNERRIDQTVEREAEVRDRLRAAAVRSANLADGRRRYLVRAGGVRSLGSGRGADHRTVVVVRGGGGGNGSGNEYDTDDEDEDVRRWVERAEGWGIRNSREVAALGGSFGSLGHSSLSTSPRMEYVLRTKAFNVEKERRRREEAAAARHHRTGAADDGGSAVAALSSDSDGGTDRVEDESKERANDVSEGDEGGDGAEEPTTGGALSTPDAPTETGCTFIAARSDSDARWASTRETAVAPFDRTGGPDDGDGEREGVAVPKTVTGDKDGREDSYDEDAFDCTICLCTVENGDRIGVLSCAHIFHVDCLREWIKRRNVCPLCQESGIATPRSVLTSTRHITLRGRAVSGSGEDDDGRQSPAAQTTVRGRRSRGGSRRTYQSRLTMLSEPSPRPHSQQLRRQRQQQQGQQRISRRESAHRHARSR